jgi:hypothetical protein
LTHSEARPTPPLTYFTTLIPKEGEFARAEEPSLY